MILVTIVFTVLLTFYLYCTRKNDYWKKRGIKYEKPVFLFGSHLKEFIILKSPSQVAEDTYWKYQDEKIVGGFRAMKPELVIRDPEIAKAVLINDFQYVYRRGFGSKMEPILRNLFFADGDLWRQLRHRLTSAFTTAKLKAMFPLVVDRAERLQALTLQAAAAGQDLDAKEMMARYTTDFIGACGFGLDVNSLHDENSAFRKLGREIFQITPKIFIVNTLKELFPNVFKSLKFYGNIEISLTNLVNDILTQRNFKPSGRNDFIDLLIECKDKDAIVNESSENNERNYGTTEPATWDMSVELMAAQVFMFFSAGFETSSTSTSYTLHLLAYNQDVQKKVHEEIDKVLSKHGNKLNYDAIQEMTYLEWTFKEAMRIFPPVGYIQRETVREYTIPGVDVTIDEGVLLVIPLQALHNDPKYFDNPDEFRPERFDPEVFDSNNKYVYMPFGNGPRACIGLRLGLMQSLAGLAAVLSQFTVLPSAASQRRPPADPAYDITQSVKGKLPLIFQQRKHLN